MFQAIVQILQSFWCITINKFSLTYVALKCFRNHICQMYLWISWPTQLSFLRERLIEEWRLDLITFMKDVETCFWKVTFIFRCRCKTVIFTFSWTHSQYILYLAAISDFPNYGILITGYSLGAGVCQLLTMDIVNRQNEGGEIPPEVPIRGLSFGSPPVYECPENRTHPNIFSVVNNHDGLGTWLTISYLYNT